ncbi:I78 family peptidase inhibitor [Novosphingobium album (ex Hu et al. 2023)]|uniref:I78 family peptidase inhibitor n=1 Tax=Novosphingobium album (ex Hu et al. 2023) TaxID=2930093 RepID=A0ABT0AXN3_9SPHN|nr:I78 family peptidase inhibitor [Novosphingobium album (ex Hu et al. 2023)]MCJ2177578.1 I78 family peptidase inhibitor [Novosphingobium album (ex Hu et al. 2023)]
MITPRLALAATLLNLAACSAETPPVEAAMPPRPSLEPGCGAEELSAYIGTKATDEAVAAIRAWRGDHPVRVLTPGTIVTMDYRPDRLNINVDADGVIKGFRCT